MNKSKTEFNSVKYRLDDCIDLGLLNRNSNVFVMYKVNNGVKIERFIISINDSDNKIFNIIPFSKIDASNQCVKPISSVKDMIDKLDVFNLNFNLNKKDVTDVFSTSDFDRAIYLKNKSALILYSSNEESTLLDSIYIRLYISDLILKNLIEDSLNCLDLQQTVKYDIDDCVMNHFSQDISIDIESTIRSSLNKFENLLSEKIKDENVIQSAIKEYSKIHNNIKFYKITFEFK